MLAVIKKELAREQKLNKLKDDEIMMLNAKINELERIINGNKKV